LINMIRKATPSETSAASSTMPVLKRENGQSSS